MLGASYYKPPPRLARLTENPPPGSPHAHLNHLARFTRISASLAWRANPSLARLTRPKCRSFLASAQPRLIHRNCSYSLLNGQIKSLTCQPLLVFIFFFFPSFFFCFRTPHAFSSAIQNNPDLKTLSSIASINSTNAHNNYQKKFQNLNSNIRLLLLFKYNRSLYRG